MRSEEENQSFRILAHGHRDLESLQLDASMVLIALFSDALGFHTFQREKHPFPPCWRESSPLTLRFTAYSRADPYLGELEISTKANPQIEGSG
jgi:hypothetical protein